MMIQLLSKGVSGAGAVEDCQACHRSYCNVGRGISRIARYHPLAYVCAFSYSCGNGGAAQVILRI